MVKRKMELKELRKVSTIAKNWILIKISTFLPPGKFKNWLLRRTGASIHRDAWVSPDVIIDPVFPEEVVLGPEAFIGWGTKVFTHMIMPDWTYKRDKVLIAGFVGGDCTIEPGCKIYGTLGAHSYLRYGKKIQKGEYWYGIPAKNSRDIR